MSSKRARSAATLAATAMASGAGWGLPTPADAREAGTLSSDRPTPPVAPGHASEAELYAEDFEVDVPEARERLARQGRLGATLGQLRQLAGDRLAGAWIEHRPDLRGVVRLTGPVADAAAFDALVGGSPVAIEVRTDAPLSLTQLEAERARVQEELVRTLPGATTGLHEQSGSVMVYAPAATQGQRQSSEGALPEVRALTDAPVRVTYRRGEAGPMHDYGGDRMRKGTTPWCTTGFSVHHGPSGQEGFVTAGHCEPPLDYAGWDGEAAHPLTRRAAEASPVTDVAVYTSSHDSFPEFYADSRTSRRTLTGVQLWADQAVGSFVCHQGITSGHTCGTITDRATTECYTGPPTNVCDPNWVRVEGASLACAGGDSGGPWFNSSTAYGVLHGGLTFGSAPGQCPYVIYSPIDFKFSRLNAAVLTG